MHLVQQTSWSFTSEFPRNFHLRVKSALSTSIFPENDTAKEDPLTKIFFAVSKWCLMKNPDWLYCGIETPTDILIPLQMSWAVSFFLFFSLSMNISHGIFIPGEFGQLHHTNFLNGNTVKVSRVTAPAFLARERNSNFCFPDSPILNFLWD